MNLENAILDMYDDINLRDTLVKIGAVIPEDVRNEQLPDVTFRDTLPDNAFALTIFTKNAYKLNRFPIDSKLNTSLSNIYFDLNHHKLPEGAVKIAASLIKKACSRFNIDPTYSVNKASEPDIALNVFFENPFKSNEKYASRIEEPNPCEHFALKNKYPLENKEHIKKACDYFNKYASNLTLDDKHTYAFNTFNRAAELGVKTTPEIEKYAAARYGSPSILEQALSMRKALLPEDSSLRKEFDKVGAFKVKATPNELTKALAQLDKEAHLDRYYDTHIKDPYETICGIDKTASYVYSKNDIYMTEDDLKKLPNTKEKILKDYFGDTLVKGLKSDGVEAFTALPDDSKDIIARIWNGDIQ